jgi:hypothetical protein
MIDSSTEDPEIYRADAAGGLHRMARFVSFVSHG